MLLVVAFGLVQLLQLIAMGPTGAAGDPLRTRSNLEEAAAPVQADDGGGGGDARRAAVDVGDHAEPVSRRRLYGDESMPWNNQDMAWLTRRPGYGQNLDRTQQNPSLRQNTHTT